MKANISNTYEKEPLLNSYQPNNINNKRKISLESEDIIDKENLIELSPKGRNIVFVFPHFLKKGCKKSTTVILCV